MVSRSYLVLMTNTNTAVHKAYETLRASKSSNKRAWLACADLCFAAAARADGEVRQALEDRAESAEMNARNCK